MAYTVLQLKGNLLPRAITGLIAIPAVIFIILQGHIHFQIMVLLAAIGLLREWSNLSFGKTYHWLSIGCFTTILLNFFFPNIWSLLITLAGCAWLLYFKTFEWKKLIIISLGYLYITSATIVMLNTMPQLGSHFTLLIFVLVWSVDTGAFLVGKTIGGPKLAPNISPNKTWSGFIGGIIFGLLTIHYLTRAINFNVSKDLWIFVIISILVAQIGDLLESWCKRYFKVKDSGSFLPGHGGMLDRLDSLLAVSFVVAVFWYFGKLP